MSLNFDKSGWKRVRFGDVVRNVNESVRDPYGDGIDRVIAMEHMDPGELTIGRWSSIEEGTSFTRRVRPGQTLFGKRRAYQRKVAFAEFDAICSGDILTLEADETEMLSVFLPFLVQSDAFFDHALGTSAGSLSPRTSWRELDKFELHLPPLDEQECIADLLWALEKERVAASDLRDMLEDAHVALGRKLLGDIEKRHGRTLLTDLVREKITDGVREKGADVEGGVPYVRVSDMTVPQLSSEGMLRMSRELAEANVSSRMRSGDIVMALRSKIGLCHLVPQELDECNIAQGVAKISPDLSRVRAEYLFEVLMAPRTQTELDRVAKGTTIREVGLKALRAFTIPFAPDTAEQQAFVDVLQKVRTAVQSTEARRRALNSLRASFLTDVFGGTA